MRAKILSVAPGSVWSMVAVGLCLATPACKPKAMTGDSMSTTPTVASIDQAERALADNQRRLAEFGLAPAPAEQTDVGDGGALVEQEEDPAPEPEPGRTEVGPSPSPSPPPADAPVSNKRVAGGGDKSQRCARICDLAESSCQLAVQICDLAAGHAGQVRYQDACTAAREQCELATDACSGCEPRTD